MRFNSVSFLLGLVLCLTTSTQSLYAGADVWYWPPGESSVEPQNPTTSNTISISLSGDWPDGCTFGTSEISVSGNDILFNVIYHHIGEVCTLALVPWQGTHAIGPLAAGTYTVFIRLLDDPRIGQDYQAVTEFVVAISPDERLPEAQQLALEVGGGLLPDAQLADQILNDLAAIRSAYPEASVGYRSNCSPDRIIVGLTEEAMEQFLNDEFHELDELNEQYGVVDIIISQSLTTVHLVVDKVYNTQLLAEIYSKRNQRVSDTLRSSVLLEIVLRFLLLLHCTVSSRNGVTAFRVVLTADHGTSG